MQLYDGTPLKDESDPMQHPSIDLKCQADAAAYAVLRRLAPAIRHQMAGSFQPVTMLAAVIEKRLRAVIVDVPGLIKTSSDVRAMATNATRSSLDLLGWLSPDPAARVPLNTAIEDAMHLVATELSFRGFKCINQTEGVATEVALIHMRGVFVTALLALTDAADAPAKLLLTAQSEDNGVAVTLALLSFDASGADAQPEVFQPAAAAYRKIDWPDVQSVAAAHGVHMERSMDAVLLHIPRASSSGSSA